MTGRYDGERPDTASGALHSLADWLDEADRLIDKLAAARGIDRSNSGDAVQQDMRGLAAWFAQHPAEDASAWGYVTGRPAAPVVQGADELRSALIRALTAPDGGAWWSPKVAADAVLALPEVARLLAERDQAQAAVQRVRELVTPDPVTGYPVARSAVTLIRRALDGDGA